MESIFVRIGIWYVRVFLHAGVIIYEIFRYSLQVIRQQSYYSLAQLAKAAVFGAAATAVYVGVSALVGHNDIVLKIVYTQMGYVIVGIIVEYIHPHDIYVWAVDEWPDFWRLARYHPVLFCGAALILCLVMV
jgi:hypothetical protein